MIGKQAQGRLGQHRLTVGSRQAGTAIGCMLRMHAHSLVQLFCLTRGMVEVQLGVQVMHLPFPTNCESSQYCAGGLPNLLAIDPVRGAI